MITELKPPYCTRQFGQVVLEGVQEVIGRVGLTAVLNLARLTRLVRMEAAVEVKQDLSIVELRAVRVSLEELYGPRGGRGVALRAGRASYRYFLRQYGETMGLNRMDYRLQPAPVRIRQGLESIAVVLSTLGLRPVVLREDDRAWHVHAPDCPWCTPAEGDEMACQFPVGLLQEYLNWASAGRVFHVIEGECCAAKGQECVISVDKHPLD